MVEQRPARPDWLVSLTYDVRRLVHSGKWEVMQTLIARTAERQGVSEWELARLVGEVGAELGIAQAPVEVAGEDLVQ